MAEKDYTYKQEMLARYAKALGNPARIAIMEFLAMTLTANVGASKTGTEVPLI